MKMRLTLIISTLTSGGAERVLSILANYWAEKAWPVTLLTFDDGREAPFFTLHSKVIHVALGIAPPAHTPGTSRGVHKQIISIGRLSPEKGFDLLLEAFARLATRHPDWSVVIWGEGEAREVLEHQRDRLGLGDRVSFPGRTKRP